MLLSFQHHESGVASDVSHAANVLFAPSLLFCTRVSCGPSVAFSCPHWRLCSQVFFLGPSHRRMYCNMLLVIVHDATCRTNYCCTVCFGQIQQTIFCIVSLALMFAAKNISKTMMPLKVVPVILVVMACLGLLQILGHVVFEGRFPAFRFFEAAVTTPFFLFMNTCFWLGYKPQLRDTIYAKSIQWKGTERRKFAWAKSAED